MRASCLRPLAAALGLAAAAPGHALAPGTILAQTLEPAPPGDPLFTVADPRAPGPGALAVGLTTSYARRPVVLERDGRAIPGGELVREQLWSAVQASLGIGSRVRVDAAMPFALHQAGDRAFSGVQRVSAAAPGDFRLGGQASLRSFGRADVAAALDLWLPTGGRGGYATDGRVQALPKLVAGSEAGPFTWGALLGVRLARMLDVGYASTGPGVAYAAGLAWRRGAFRVGPEAWGQVGFAGTRSPLEALLGGHWSPAAFDLGLAVSTTVRADPGGAPLRVVLTVAARPGAGRGSSGAAAGAP
jgi:hypothetical protein